MVPHLVIRPMRSDDIAVALRWADDERFREAAGWSRRARSDRAERWSAALDDPDSPLTRLAAFADGELIGYVDLVGSEPDARELGFAIGPSNRWAQGFGTRIAAAGVGYGFTMLSLRTIWAQARPTNERSLRVLRSAGLVETPVEDGSRLGAVPGNLAFRITRESWVGGAIRQSSPP